ncbi:MAG: hypothetical protein IJJ98_14975 [Prevotella sp.]|nr:hypothetical protein [Prevotella sp.]
MGTDSTNNTLFIYRLTFGDVIAYDNDPKQMAKLEINQGVRKKISDGTNSYYLLLLGIKVNRRIYQPTEIEAELDITQTTTDGSNQKSDTAPKFSDIRGLLLQRQVNLDMLEVVGTTNVLEYKEPPYSIAKNCYVFEMTPQLNRDVNGTKMYVKLSIFSMDKLMTLNRYSKAYVASKLGAEILQHESLNFGILKENVPLIDSDTDSLQHLMYTEGDKKREFIQPYLVQYNESFYDFLVRTSNRCGEFLYFEDGKLVLGLPDSGTPVEISNYETVTAQERSIDPLIVGGYARDSVKDGIGAVKGAADAKKDEKGALDLNISAIAREATGFPNDAFPTYASVNVEQAQDDYIFPLYKGMFTNRKRELCYDGNASQTALLRMMQFGKTLLSNELDGAVGGVVPLVIDSIVGEAIPTMLADLRVSTYNAGQGERYIEILKGKGDQYNEQKAVQFATANAEGWATLHYYQDIRQHEEAQQRKIVCINMGTSFINVKMGQKIKIAGLDQVYVIIQIQHSSEEAWNRDYDRYGMAADDKYEGKRSLRIYAIPGYGFGDSQFIPPVHPVPVVRKVGPQTAFVTDNEDPKFQGRVRVAFPWQSLSGVERAELAEVDHRLQALETYIWDLKDKAQMYLGKATKASQFIDELKEYVKSTKDEREELLQSRNKRAEALEKELKELKELRTKKADTDDKKNKADEIIEKRKAEKREKDIKDKEAEKKKIKDEISELKAAALEHDQKKDRADYKDVEKDNTVIKKYKTIYNNENEKYNDTNAELKDVDTKKKDENDRREVLKAKIQENLNMMATPWVRVVTPMATPGGGTFFRPRVGDEVLVDFENGNVERPYVIGSVFSKNNLTPDEKMYRQRGVELQGRDVSMAMMSPNGHHITFTDPDGGTNFLTHLVSPGLGLWGSIAGASFNNLLPGAKDLAGGIHIGDRYGIYEIDMKSHKRSIEINSPYGTVSINAFSGITINAPNGDITIKGKNINLEAGNKINLLSGKNIEEPGFGDPEGKAYKAAKALTDLFAEIIPTEITKYFFSSVVDLSYIRHVVEVFVRPVDGTLKLKSKRYLMLEAGKGNTTIRRDRYAAKVQENKQSQEEFFKAMLECVKFICEKFDNFYQTYESLWKDGYKKQTAYENDARGAKMKDIKNPDLKKLAHDTDEWSDEVVTLSIYKDILDSMMFPIIEQSANAYTEAAFKIYRHVESFETILDDYSDLPLGDFKWLGGKLAEALNEVDDKCRLAKGWMQVFANGNEHQLLNVSEPDPKTDKFATANKKIFKRKLLLAFISKVGESPENAGNKYFRCGLRIDEILASNWISQEFYWNRTVFFLDRSKTINHNNYRRKLYDSSVGLIEKNLKKFAAPFDRDIWNDKADGQILFSDQENSTLNFQREGVHEESSSNIGTLDHLKKELMAIK